MYLEWRPDALKRSMGDDEGRAFTTPLPVTSTFFLDLTGFHSDDFPVNFEQILVVEQMFQLKVRLFDLVSSEHQC